MKHSFLFTLLFSLLVSSNAFSIDVPVVIPTPNPHIQNTIKTSKLLSVQVSSNDSEITLCFGSSTGTYTLALKDESGMLVYMETINVTSGLVYYLPIDLFENGNYILTISGSNGSTVGTFTVIIN